MTRIGLLSDTHSFLDPAVLHHFAAVDEIWHAGDFGAIGILEDLRRLKPLRAVWGNIDEPGIRRELPEIASFTIEGLKVLMIHIGGYPGKYTPMAAKALDLHRPGLFITGHSHILKVMFDEQRQCLHMNPGAAGHQGWHSQRTIIRFTINGSKAQDCEVIELGRRGAQSAG